MSLIIISSGRVSMININGVFSVHVSSSPKKGKKSKGSSSKSKNYISVSSAGIICYKYNGGVTINKDPVFSSYVPRPLRSRRSCRSRRASPPRPPRPRPPPRFDHEPLSTAREPLLLSHPLQVEVLE